MTAKKNSISVDITQDPAFGYLRGAEIDTMLKMQSDGLIKEKIILNEVTEVKQVFINNPVVGSGDGNFATSIDGANVIGAVATATHANVADTANSIPASGIIGTIANASYATYAGTVGVANVTGIGNIATINKDGSNSNVLYGNGVFASLPAGYGNSNVASYLPSYSGDLSPSNVHVTTNTLLGDNNTSGAYHVYRDPNQVSLGSTAGDMISINSYGISIGGTGGVNIQGAANANITIGSGTTGNVKFPKGITFNDGTTQTTAYTGQANNPFDQNLNTSNSVTFSNVNVGNINAPIGKSLGVKFTRNVSSMMNSVMDGNVTISPVMVRSDYNIFEFKTNNFHGFSIYENDNEIKIGNESSGQNATFKYGPSTPDGKDGDFLIGTTRWADPHGGNLWLSTGSDDYRWKFDKTGNLTFPDGTTQPTAYTGHISTANITGLGNLALINKDGNASNILYGNGVFAAAPSGGSSYGNSNVATFLASFGSNNISTTGNVSVKNVYANSHANLVFGDASATGNPGMSSTSTFSIVANSGSTLTEKQWMFENDGNLVLPQADVHASPAPTLSGIVFSDGTFQNTAFTGGGSTGNPFDQSLNTTNSPSFAGLTVNNGGISLPNGDDIYTGNGGSIDLYTDWESGQGVEVWLQHNEKVSVNTGSGNYSWSFDKNGVFQLPNYVNQTSTSTVTCAANTDTVVYTSTDNNHFTIKLLVKVEGQENSIGQWETQSCEIMIARSFNGNKVAGSVYGLVYTSTGPLATFTTRLNSLTNNIEVLCRPSAADSVYVRSFATEILTSD